jgi:hypothetical protein
MEQVLNGTTNYLVPASGKTHSVTYSGLFSVTPLNVDWRQFSVDNYQFQPQGVFIDNSLGIADLVITILPINYKVICPLGIVGQFQFPAPDNQTCTITGNGQASVIFVDFPVLPNAGLINIGNTVNAQIVGPNPLPVSLPATPLQVQGPTNSNASSVAYEASHIIKAAPGKLFGLTIYNSKATAQFIQLHDAAALPIDTAIPVVLIYAQATSSVSFDLGIFGRNFTNGIVVCNSSTGPTKTIGAADLFIDAQYI